MNQCDQWGQTLLIVLRRCSGEAWDITLQAFTDAKTRTGATAAVVSTLPENLPESVREHLLAHGIAPMQGLAECLAAIHAAAVIGHRQTHWQSVMTLPDPNGTARISPAHTLDEWQSKQALAAHGLPVPAGHLIEASDAVAAANALGYPVVTESKGSSKGSDSFDFVRLR